MGYRRKAGSSAASSGETLEADAQTTNNALAEQHSQREQNQQIQLSLTLRTGIALLALLGLVLTIATQVKLSVYAASGDGAAQVSAPPLLVAASLLMSLSVALLLHVPGAYSMYTSVTAATYRARRGIHCLRAYGRSAQIFASPRGWAGTIVRLIETMSARGWGCVVVTALALIMSFIADSEAAVPAVRPVGQWWWLASMALLPISACISPWPVASSTPNAGWRFSHQEIAVSSGAQSHLPAFPPPLLRHFWGKLGDVLLLVILLLVALLLRLPGLTSLPYPVHGDEAACGLQALRWLHGEVSSLLSVGWYGLPVAGYGIPALVMGVAGADLFGLRLSSVIVGTLSIVLLYALARQFTGRRVACIAAALLTIAHLHIQFSRMGIHYIHAPFVILLTLWLLVRALCLNSALSAVLTGVGLSLALQVYFSARIVFILMPLFLLGLLILNRRLLNGRILALAWAALGVLVALGPLAVYFRHDMAAFTGRSAEVLILNLTPYRHTTLISQFGTADLHTILLRQLAAVPLLPGSLADQSFQYGPRYPLFDALVAALVLIGFWYALLRLRHPLCLLLIIWVVSTVALGGVLTIDMPWWPRLLAMLPALCLLAALALEALLSTVESMLRDGMAHIAPDPALFPLHAWLAAAIALLLAVDVVGYSYSQSIRHYFSDYPHTVDSDSYRTQYTDIGYYVARLPAGTRVILFSTGGLIWDYSTLQFLAPQAQASGQLVNSVATLPLALARKHATTVVIIPLGDVANFQHLLSSSDVLPPGQYSPQSNVYGHITFYTYTCPPGP